MAQTQTFLVRLSLAVRRLLPLWHSPLNSLALYGHVLLVLLCAAFLAVMAGVGALDDEIRCVDQRTQEPVREQWLLALCTQYSGTEFQGRRRDALSYSLFHYLVMFMLALNLVPSAVRSHLDHRQMQKFLRTFGDNERQAAVAYGAMFTGIHSGMRQRKAAVSFVSLLVMAVNVVVLLTSSHLTLLDPSSYPFEQYLGETLSQFGHVFPGTAQCRVQPSMMLGAYTDTYGCHFPLAQHYRHMLLAMLIVVGVGLVLSLLTFVTDAVMTFAGPSASLIHTACRDPDLERRVARQWTRDELEALRLVRQKTDMDAFVWILSQLDFEEDPVEVVAADQPQARQVTSTRVVIPSADPFPAPSKLLEKEMAGLVSKGVLLGEGCYGWAFRARYQGADVVVKKAKAKHHAWLFEKEAKTLVCLNGLGGAPRVLATCQDCPGFLMEYCNGKTLQAMLMEAAPVGTLLRGIHDLALRLREVHQAGFAHNDLKIDNVILEVTTDGAVRGRLIDLGLSTRLGESPGLLANPKDFPHIAPELLRMGAATVESDLFSLGAILLQVLRAHARSFPEDSELFQLARAMTCPDPRARPRFHRCQDVLADSLGVARQE